MNMNAELDEKQKETQKRIQKRVFELERTNYKQKNLNSNQVIQKLTKIIEDEVKLW